MLRQWRYMFKWLLLALGVISLATCLLGLVFYLPALTDGPTGLDYLVRGRCSLEKIDYIVQQCPLPPNGFVNPYVLQWQECRLIQLKMTDGQGGNCTWIFPQSYENQKQAEIAVKSKGYRVGQELACVVDSVNQICFPEGSEVLEIVLVATIPFVFGVIFLGVFLYLQYYKKDWIFGD